MWNNFSCEKSHFQVIYLTQPPFFLRLSQSCKDEYFMIILGYFFLVLHKNICCGYSLEEPCQGASNEYQQLLDMPCRGAFNEYPQYIFLRKIQNCPQILSLTTPQLSLNRWMLNWYPQCFCLVPSPYLITTETDTIPEWANMWSFWYIHRWKFIGAQVYTRVRVTLKASYTGRSTTAIWEYLRARIGPS